MIKKMFMAAVVAVAFSVAASAQSGARFGVTAGFTSSDAKSVENFDFKSVAQYNVGVTCNLPLPFGLAIQPALLYQSKSMNASAGAASSKTTVGYLEVPVQVQWGLDLLLARPYVFAEPFVGVGLNTKTTGSLGGWSASTDDNAGFDVLKRMEYGVALGAGVDIWKLQVSLKYFWNLGNLFDENGKVGDVTGDVMKALKTNYQGVTINAVYFF